MVVFRSVAHRRSRPRQTPPAAHLIRRYCLLAPNLFSAPNLQITEVLYCQLLKWRTFTFATAFATGVLKRVGSIRRCSCDVESWWISDIDGLSSSDESNAGITKSEYQMRASVHRCVIGRGVIGGFLETPCLNESCGDFDCERPTSKRRVASQSLRRVRWLKTFCQSWRAELSFLGPNERPSTSSDGLPACRPGCLQTDRESEKAV